MFAFSSPFSRLDTARLRQKMGKANLKILAEAWLQIIENYCADFQEPYPPTEVLKDILDWMPTAEGDSLIECEWFDKNFPPVTTPRPACGCPFARADVARALQEGLLMAHMIPSLKLYRQLMAEASAPPAAEVTAAQPHASVRPPSHTASHQAAWSDLPGWVDRRRRHSSRSRSPCLSRSPSQRSITHRADAEV